jgi:hypothetical protein
MNYIKKKSLKQEDRTAEDFDGRTRGKASGASWNKKGDVKTAKFLIENKFTDKDAFPLKVKTWLKIETEAIREGLRTPLIQLDIQDKQFIIADLNFLIQYTKNLYIIRIPMKNPKQQQYLLHKDDFSFIIEDSPFVLGKQDKLVAYVIPLLSTKNGFKKLTLMLKDEFIKLIGEEIDE